MSVWCNEPGPPLENFSCRPSPRCLKISAQTTSPISDLIWSLTMSFVSISSCSTKTYSPMLTSCSHQLWPLCGSFMIIVRAMIILVIWLRWSWCSCHFGRWGKPVGTYQNNPMMLIGYRKNRLYIFGYETWMFHPWSWSSSFKFSQLQRRSFGTLIFLWVRSLFLFTGRS